LSKESQQFVLAAHVEIGVVLTGKAGLGQVLRGRAGADRDRPSAERPVGLEHRLLRDFTLPVGLRGQAEPRRDPFADSDHRGQPIGLAANRIDHPLADGGQVDRDGC
jgi:hypothetical protein